MKYFTVAVMLMCFPAMSYAQYDSVEMNEETDFLRDGAVSDEVADDVRDSEKKRVKVMRGTLIEQRKRREKEELENAETVRERALQRKDEHGVQVEGRKEHLRKKVDERQSNRAAKSQGRKTEVMRRREARKDALQKRVQKRKNIRQKRRNRRAGNQED